MLEAVFASFISELCSITSFTETTLFIAAAAKSAIVVAALRSSSVKRVFP
mgnify:CR=1 FL=1